MNPTFVKLAPIYALTTIAVAGYCYLAWIFAWA